MEALIILLTIINLKCEFVIANIITIIQITYFID